MSVFHKLIFEEKTVSGSSGFGDGFVYRVSTSRPWEPGGEKDFKLKTYGKFIGNP